MDTGEVKLETIFRVTVTRLWKALTDIHEMKQWYFPMLEAFLPEPGFETVFTVHNEGQEYPHRWKITEAIPNQKLGYSWRFDGFPGDSLLSFELFEVPEGTKLRLVHSGLQSFQPKQHPQLSKDNFEAGWNQIIGTALKTYLEQHPDAP